MLKFTVDYTAKLFIAKPGVVDFDVKVDLYSDAVEHWIDDATANQFTFPMVAVGGVDIDVGAGTSVPSYVFLVNGWRVRPQESSHTLAVEGGVLLVDGGGDPFVNTLAAFTVRILYQQPVQAIGVSSGAVVAPSQQEIRDSLKLAASAGAPAAGSIDDRLPATLSSGRMRSSVEAMDSAVVDDIVIGVCAADCGGLTPTESLQLEELWLLNGLSTSDQLIVTPTSRNAGPTISQAIETLGTTVTATRNP